MGFDLEAIKAKMLVRYPVFGSVIANTKFISKESITTAETDGDDIFYNSKFMEGLSEKQQVFVLAHEVGHIAYDHISGCDGKDMNTWNEACDAVINIQLYDDGLEIIPNCIFKPDAREYSAEEYYEKLMKENKPKDQQTKGHDSHDKWEEAAKNKKNEQTNPNNKNSSDSENTADNSQNEKKSSDDSNNNSKSSNNSDTADKKFWDRIFDRRKNRDDQDKNKENNKNNNTKKENNDDSESKKKELEDKAKKEEKKREIDKLSKEGEAKSFKRNKIERKQQIEELKKIMTREMLSAGNTTNQSYRNISDIGTADALIDWKTLLVDALNIKMDWTYENATIEYGVVTPHLEEIPNPKTEIVLDTSGSVNEVLLKNFLRECKNILENSVLKVGCFDTEFYGFYEIKTEKDIDNMLFEGGGGTDFDVAVNAFSPDVENKIIFTDGDADMPERVVDAIWIVFGNIKISPKGGRVIYIDEECLEKLSYINEENYGMKK